MAEKTITLRAELVERLERIASEQGRSVDEVVEDMLPKQAVNPLNNWALRLAEGMAAADIDWQEPPEGKTSRELYEDHLQEKWLRSQEQTR
jgi:predicted transcriptional regulator